MFANIIRNKKTVDILIIILLKFLLSNNLLSERKNMKKIRKRKKNYIERMKENKTRQLDVKTKEMLNAMTDLQRIIFLSSPFAKNLVVWLHDLKPYVKSELLENMHTSLQAVMKDLTDKRQQELEQSKNDNKHKKSPPQNDSTAS